MHADVGCAKMAARVLRCFAFMRECYRKVIALATQGRFKPPETGLPAIVFDSHGHAADWRQYNNFRVRPRARLHGDTECLGWNGTNAMKT